MIKRQARTPSSPVKVTFAVPDAGVGVSLVSDLNGWDPTAHPLKKRSNGTRSVSLELDPGTELQFRYAYADGGFADDPDADGYVPNAFGTANGLVTV